MDHMTITAQMVKDHVAMENAIEDRIRILSKQVGDAIGWENADVINTRFPTDPKAIFDRWEIHQKNSGGEGYNAFGPITIRAHWSHRWQGDGNYYMVEFPIDYIDVLPDLEEMATKTREAEAIREEAEDKITEKQKKDFRQRLYESLKTEFEQ